MQDTMQLPQRLSHAGDPAAVTGSRVRKGSSLRWKVRGVSHYCLVRRPKLRKYWPGPDVPAYHPRWFVSWQVPGAKESGNVGSSYFVGGDGAFICAACLAVPRGESPGAVRSGCACQRELRKCIEAEIAVALKAYETSAREGRLDKYLELIDKPVAVSGGLTVGEVCERARRMPDAWGSRTLQTYLGALRRLARFVNAADPDAVPVSVIMSRETVEGFFAQSQGLAVPDWRRALDVNGPANATVRNAKALFSDMALATVFRDVSFPQLEAWRRVPFLRAPASGFMPWPAGEWERMIAEAEGLPPELRKVNLFLRKTGLRIGELLAARRDWITMRDGAPVLMIRDRGAAFSLLKHGKGRAIALDAELFALVEHLPGEAFLIGDGMAPSTRRELVEVLHSAFVRRFIPDRQKSNHELRMMVGSIVGEREGWQRAADMLGHTNLATFMAFYHAQLTPVGVA